MAKKTTTSDEVVEIISNKTLPVLSCDGVNVSTRKDGFSLLRFLCSIPEGQVEQARIMIPNENLKKIVDLVCIQLQYSPQPMDISASNPASKKKAEPKKH